MKYLFWAYMVIWILVSFYLFYMQRRLQEIELHLDSVEKKLPQPPGREEG